MKEQEEIIYPYIPKGRTILYAPTGNPFIQAAREAARRSNDQQQPTGAAIVASGKILEAEPNRNSLNSKKLINLHKKYCVRHMLGIPSGKMYWLCPGCTKNENHAESRAVKKLLKGEKPEGPFDVYVWGHWWCCDVCWKNMMRLPVRDVYLLENSERLFNLKSPENIIGKQF